MRLTLVTSLLILCSSLIGHAAIVEFDLSPPGTDSSVGLHPLNEVIPGLSYGSGDEFGSGIFFDTGTRHLTLNLAYGSAFGFTDLTGPAFSWLLHGPSPFGETAPVLFNLQSFHTFASDPSSGGHIAGSFTLTTEQEAALLSGLTYINIYTPANLGGEIRGQLVVVPEPQAWALLALGAGVVTASIFVRRRAASAR
jgi:CHRD domain